MIGFDKVSFKRHNLLAYNEEWNLPELGKIVLVEDKKGLFHSAYLDHREWKDISENEFDWFNASDRSYLAELEGGKIIAWYENI